MKKALSIILCLAMLVSVIPANVFAAPAAVVGGDTAYEATEEQGSLSSDTCTVSFDAGTSAPVTNMPDSTQVNKNATFVVPDTVPQREGYLFEGWVTSLGSSEIVTSHRIAQDTTFYATWTKGGYMADFNNPGDTMNTNNGSVTLADGATMTVTQGKKDTWALDTEKGEVFYTIDPGSGKMDFHFDLTLPSNVKIHTSDIKEIIIAARTDAPVGNRISKIYYNTKNENNVNNGGLSETKTITNIPIALTGNIEDKIVTHFPASKVTAADEWKDYISVIRNNFLGTDANCSGSSLYLDYIKVPGIPSIEYLDISAENPVASAEKFGAEAFSSNSSDYTVKEIRWVGGEFVAENYFDGTTKYTVEIDVEAADGKAISDSPAAAVVNGMPATVVSDGETATITYTFPATDDLLPIRVMVNTKDNVAAEINEAWGTLQLESAIRVQGGAVDTGVIWSIPEAYSKIATIDQNGLVSAIYNCDALPVVATSKYDHKTTGTIDIRITNQSDPLNVTFEAGTDETVKNLPASAQEKGFYTLPADTATTTRTSYALKGWSKTVGGEIVKEDFITEDTTYYAVWGYTKADQMSSKSATAFTAANSEDTFTATYKTGTPNYTVVAPTNTDVEKGVIFYANRAGKKALFSNANRVLLDSFEYIEMRTTLAPTDIELTAGVATSDEDGENATELENVTYAGDELSAIVDFDGEWYSYKIPTADFDNWENYLEEIKLVFVKKDANGNAVAMDTFNADFIRLVGRDIPVVDVTLDTPVAATEFSGDAVTVHNGYEVASVEWTPALLADKYFAGNTAYTAKITLDVVPGYFMFPSRPVGTYVNGAEAEYKRTNSNKSAVLTYTFEATEDVDFDLADITYYEKNTDTVTETEKFIVGNSVNIIDRVPANVPYGYRWIGWSFTDGGEIIAEEVEITQNTDFYAVYEIIDYYDFSNEEHITDNIKVENGDVVFDGKWAIVTPDDAAVLTIDGFELSADDYDYLEIVFDANRAERGEVNKFTEDLVPNVVIKDSLDEYAPVLEGSEAIIVNNTLSRKYIFNLTGDGRTSSVNTLEVSPYSGTPVWAMASVKFVKNISLTEDIAITALDAPETWKTPDTKASINSSYAVKSIEWKTDAVFTADGSFAGGVVYTAEIIIDTVPGYRIDTEVVTVGGEEPDSIVRNPDGTLTVTVTYPATEALVDFEMKVADDVISKPEGSVQLVPTFTAELPVKEVTWRITSNGDGGNSAVIDENGVVTASYDGIVTVEATSVYDPTKTATATVTITNQIPYYTVHFDANTAGEVSGMPEDAHVKYDYLLPNTPPVRDGFVFAGWIENKGDTLTVTKTFVDADKTYYALWVSGLSLDFYNAAVDSPYVKNSAGVGNKTFNEEEGVMQFTSDSSPLLYINADSRDPLFVGANNTVVEIRVKFNKGGQYSVCCWFESDDMDGNVLGPAYTGPDDRFMQNAHKYIPYQFAADTYKTIQFDFSSKSDWVDGQPTYIRLDVPSGVSDPELLVTFDYIRVVSYETSEVEITGVDAPVAKAIADTDAVAKDTSKYVITDVAWKQPLLHDIYFDANTEYTALVTVKGASGYVMSSAPTKATINGKPATIGAYNGATGELTIEYTFPATQNADTSEYNTVTFSSKDENGGAVQADRVVFAGEKLAMDSVSAESAPGGTRFIGWADTEDATVPNVTGSIDVTEDVTYYAVYEEITEFDYSNPYHRPGTEARLGSSLSFDGTYAVITPAHVEAASALATPAMNIDGTRFGKVELYFSSTMDSTVGSLHYDNKFGSALKPELKFSTMDAPNAFDNVATLIGAEAVIINNRPMFKYTYDMTTDSDWNGNIASLYTNPYGNIVWPSSVKKTLYPAWGLALIKLVENEDAPAAEFEIAAPETWVAPMTAEEVICDDAFIVTELTWSPSVDGVFNAVGVYTAKLTYRADAGYKITEAAATINGEEASVVDNGDGTYTATYTFPETENLKEVEVIITGAAEIMDAGRYVQLKGTTVAVDGSVIPVTGVVWSIEDGEEIATVSENGRVYPLANGTVTVKATSVYDEYVSATHEIEISGQKELFTVTFDKNTQSGVTGLPAPIVTSGTFVPEQYALTRDDGFFFTGWATDEDAVDPAESFQITADTTLYAKWAAGYEWSFDDDATSLGKHNTKVVTYNNGIATYETASGATPSDIVVSSAGLTHLKIETAKHNKIGIRYSQKATATCIFYLQSGDGTSKSEWSENAKVYANGYGANAAGTYHTVYFDLSKHKVWHDYPYVEQVRHDNRSSTTDSVEIDWIRLYNEERVVEFDANGGLISIFGGEVASYKENHNNGDVITLPAAPERDGFEFLGWAKATEDYNKLYNGKFTVTDNVTLYAIWAEIYVAEEETAISVDVADELIVGENQTIVVQTAGDINVTGDSDVVLSFVDENNEPHRVVISESFESTMVFDLSGEGFEGVVRDIVLTLPTGTTEGVVIKNVTFTTADGADDIIGGSKPVNPGASSAPGKTEPDHPGHNSYPEYQPGQIVGGPSFNPSTNDSKTGTTPARPKDEDIVMDGGKKDPGNEKFPFVNSYDNRFADVTYNHWYFDDVVNSFELGFMNGTSDTTFDANGTVTVAQAIAVAARIHATYNNATIPDQAAGEAWSQRYINYAKSKYMITEGQFADFNAPITREQIAAIFVRVAPTSWFTKINDFTEIPDMGTNANVLRLYNAGIIVGVDDEHNFNGSANINRAEFSAIINRIALINSRIKVEEPVVEEAPVETPTETTEAAEA